MVYLEDIVRLNGIFRSLWRHSHSKQGKYRSIERVRYKFLFGANYIKRAANKCDAKDKKSCVFIRNLSMKCV